VHSTTALRDRHACDAPDSAARTAPEAKTRRRALFPFIDTAPRAARPIAVLGLILVNTLVFLWMESLPAPQLDGVLLHYALVPLRYSDPALARAAGLNPDNWWPLFTNTFMHGSWLHLGLNMWFLWIFGPAMEARFGHIGFLLLYIPGALVASAVHFVTHLDSSAPALGASGAIAAVLGAYAMIFPRERVITLILLGFIPLFVPVPAILFAAIWFFLQILQASTELLAFSGHRSDIAWWAHIGGFAFGAFAGFVAQRLYVPQARTTVWSGRGRRVPDVKPHDWNWH
jgi:membrane associated rhomboid family serine protease